MLSVMLAFPLEVLAQGGGTGTTNYDGSGSGTSGQPQAQSTAQPKVADRESVVQNGEIKNAEPTMASVSSGSASAGPSGSFVYNLPLTGPSQALSLSLTYDSQVGNGLFGMGARMSGAGVSSIQRVDAGMGITYTASDTFAFNPAGWDVPASPSLHLVRLPNYLYRTKSETWATYEFRGSYIVKSLKDGTKIYYGGDASCNADTGGSGYYLNNPACRYDGNPWNQGEEWGAVTWDKMQAQQTGRPRGIYRWHLYKLVDVNGNTTQVDYFVQDGISYPLQIVSPKHTSQPRKKQLAKFVYEARPDTSPYPNQFDLRVKEIRFYGETTGGFLPIHRYVFTYEQGTSGRSRLVSVQQQGADCFSSQTNRVSLPEILPANSDVSCSNGNVMPAELFVWSDGAVNPMTSTSFASFTPTDRPQKSLQEPLLVPYTTTVLDVNWQVPVETVRTYNLRLVTHPERFFSGDFNGDGFDDVLAYYNLQHVGSSYETDIEGGAGQDQERLIYMLMGSATGLQAPQLFSRWREQASPYSRQAMVLDINGDGLSDLIEVVMKHRDVGRPESEVTISGAMGGSSGLGLMQEMRRINPVFPAFTNYNNNLLHWQTMPVDFNGDGRVDLAIVNGTTHQLYLMTGGASGLGPIVEQTPSWAPPAGRLLPPALAVVPADVNNDGKTDLLMWHYAQYVNPSPQGSPPGDNVAAMTYLLGSEQGYHTALEWRDVNPLYLVGREGQRRWRYLDVEKSFEMAVGDVTGDGLNEIFLMNLGHYEVESTRGNWNARSGVTYQIPWTWSSHTEGREILRFNGDPWRGISSGQDPSWQVQQSWGAYVQPRTNVICLRHEGDESGARDCTHSNDRFIYRESIYPAQRWQHRIGDVNGDGVGDQVLFHESNGDRPLEIAFGGVAGFSQTQLPQLSLHGGWRRIHEPQWLMELADLNGDRAMDVVLGSTGWNSGDAYLRVLMGGPQGLVERPEVSWSDQGDLMSMTVGDFNGDGLDDVFGGGRFPHHGMKVMLSQGERPDLIKEVHTSLGGRIVVTHEAIVATGAIDPLRTTCTKHESSGGCGGVRTQYVPVVTEIVRSNGRGQEWKETHSYKNARYLFAGQRSRDLGFEEHEVTNEETGEKVRTTYYQDEPFDGAIAKVEILNGEGFMVSETSRRYEAVTTIAGVTDVRPTTETAMIFDGDGSGELLYQTTVTKAYDAHGLPTDIRTCTDNDCVVTTTQYGPADDQNWLFGRVDGVKVSKGNGLLLSCSKHTYHPANVKHADQWWIVKSEELLCADAAQCQGANGGSWCAVTGGNARWVTVVQNQFYNDRGGVVQRQDAYGYQTEIEYDPDFGVYPRSVTRVYRKRGVVHRLTETTEYDHAGRAVKKRGANGEETRLEYDPLGRLKKTILPSGGEVRVEYKHLGDVQGQYLEERAFGSVLAPAPGVGGLGSPTGGVGGASLAGSGGTGGSAATIEASPWQRKYLDGLGRVYKTEKSDDGGKQVVTLYEEVYRSRRKVLRYTEPHWSGSTPTWIEVTHDSQGRPVQVVKLLASGPKTIRTITYDGKEVSMTDAKQQQTTAQFNAKGMLEVIFDAANQPLRYDYDAGYRVKRVVLPNNEELTFIYDSRGRVVSGTDSQTGTTNYTYTDVDRLSQVTDALGNVTTHFYDQIHRLQQKEVAAPGKPLEVTYYFYDGTQPNEPHAKGRLTSVRMLPKERQWWFEYDVMGNVKKETTKIEDVGGRFAQWAEEREFDRLNRLQKVRVQGSRDVEYQYSAEGSHLASVLVGGVPFALFEDHNALGQMKRKVMGKATATYTYTEEHFLDTLQTTNQRGTKLQEVKYTYDPIGNIDRIEDKLDARKTQGMTYDALSRLKTASGIYGREEYDYDEIGNIQKKGPRGFRYEDNGHVIVGTVSGNNEGGKQQQVKADPGMEVMDSGGNNGKGKTTGGKTAGGTGQVMTGGMAATGANPLGASKKESGVVGSILHSLFGGGKQGSSQQQRLQRLMQAVTTPGIAMGAIFDDAGNMTHRAENGGKKFRYVYNGENKLTEVWDDVANRKVAEYLYDFGGTRIRKMMYPTSGSPVRTFFVAGHEIRRPDGAQAETRFVSAPGVGRLGWYGFGSMAGQPTGMQVTANKQQRLSGTSQYGSPNAQWYFVWPNHLGSSEVITSGTDGEAVTKEAHFPFGETFMAGSEGSVVIAQRYTGQKLDEETGLYDYGARMYDPVMGRFTQADSVLPSPTNAQAWNRYAYTFNNPIKYNDPTGHAPKEPIIPIMVPGERAFGAGTFGPGNRQGLMAPQTYVGMKVAGYALQAMTIVQNVGMAATEGMAAAGETLAMEAFSAGTGIPIPISPLGATSLARAATRRVQEKVALIAEETIRIRIPELPPIMMDRSARAGIVDVRALRREMDKRAANETRLFEESYLVHEPGVKVTTRGVERTPADEVVGRQIMAADEYPTMRIPLDRTPTKPLQSEQGGGASWGDVEEGGIHTLSPDEWQKFLELGGK